MAKILLAEDDAHVMRLMSIWLERNGHEVIETRNGAEAQVQLQGGGIDCLVTDINMPVLDGLKLVRWMRDDAGLDLPVIMLSARCDQQNIDRSLEGYRVSLHPKPFSPSRLIAEIEGMLTARIE
jgi:CheY-like chemotaxis protein